MKIIRVAIMSLAMAAIYVASAQVPPVKAASSAGVTVQPKKPYDSTKAQLLVTKEENLQLRANAAEAAFSKQMADFRTEYQQDETALQAWEDSVRKDNGWDESYAYDRATDSWKHAEPKKK